LTLDGGGSYQVAEPRVAGRAELEELEEELAGGASVAQGTMFLGVGDAKPFAAGVEAVAGQVGEEATRQRAGVDVRSIESPAVRSLQKRYVKRSPAVLDEDAVTAEGEEELQRLVHSGPPNQHLVADAVYASGLEWDSAVGIDEGDELVEHPPTLDTDSADLDDGVVLGVEAGGFDVDRHEGDALQRQVQLDHARNRSRSLPAGRGYSFMQLR
jgi:hypothetical protein